MPIDSFLFRKSPSGCSPVSSRRDSCWCIDHRRGGLNRAGHRRQGDFSVRLEAIAVWDPTVRFARLPFRPGILEDGCGDVFGVGVSATNPSEQVDREAEA